MLLSTLLILTFLYTVLSGIGVKTFIICFENSLQKRILRASGVFSLTFFHKWVKCCFCLQKAQIKHRLCEKSSQEWNGNLDQDKSVAIISTHCKDQLSSLLLIFLFLLFLPHFLFSYCPLVGNSSICFLVLQFLPLLEIGVNWDHHLQVSSLEISFFWGAFKWEIIRSWYQHKRAEYVWW